MTRCFFPLFDSLEDDPFAPPPPQTRMPAATTPGVTWGFGSLQDHVTTSSAPQRETAMAFGTVNNLGVATEGSSTSTTQRVARIPSAGDATQGSGCNFSQSGNAKELSYEEVRIGVPFSGRVDSDEEDMYYRNAQFHDAVTLLPHDAKYVRFYLPADLKMVPFAFLEDLLALKKTSFPLLQKVELCIRSLARPFLEDLYIAACDNQHKYYLSSIVSLLSKYAAASVSLEIKFRHVHAANERNEAQNFRAVPLMEAIHGLEEHSVELTEILGEESSIGSMNGVLPEEDRCTTSSMEDEML